VGKVDVDQAPAVAQRYSVSAIPTVLIISNGKEIKRLVELKPETEYVAVLEKLVGKDKD
jgi:thioredoxin 1